MDTPTRSELAVTWVVYAPLVVLLPVVVFMGVDDWSVLNDPVAWALCALQVGVYWMLWKRSKRAT
jgi:hypothetical protein